MRAFLLPNPPSIRTTSPAAWATDVETRPFAFRRLPQPPYQSMAVPYGAAFNAWGFLNIDAEFQQTTQPPRWQGPTSTDQMGVNPDVHVSQHSAVPRMIGPVESPERPRLFSPKALRKQRVTAGLALSTGFSAHAVRDLHNVIYQPRQRTPVAPETVHSVEDI